MDRDLVFSYLDEIKALPKITWPLRLKEKKGKADETCPKCLMIFKKSKNQISNYNICNYFYSTK